MRLPVINLMERLEEAEALLFTGHDAALIGIGGAFNQRVAVYDRRRILSNLVADGMLEEEADEWIAYNMEGGYVGEKTPIIVDLFTTCHSE